jgi:MarR family transcriptional regulator, negative regulator of the multidrug operon emrRAB
MFVVGGNRSQMERATTANVLGALAVAITDRVRSVADGKAATSSTALVHLSKYGDETIDALRRPLELSHSACVRMVDRLEEEAYVSRRAGRDARSVAVRLTAKGRSKARAILRRREDALTEALAALSAAEQAQLGALLGKLLGALVSSEPEALRTCRLCDYAICPDEVCPVTRSLVAAAEERSERDEGGPDA